MPMEDFPTVLKRWKCVIEFDFQRLTDRLRWFLEGILNNTVVPPAITILSNNDNWKGYFFHFNVGPKREIPLVIYAYHAGRNGTEFIIDECEAPVYQALAREFSEKVRDWLQKQRHAEMMEYEPEISGTPTPIKMLPAPFKPRLVHKGVVDAPVLTNWFLELCDQHIDENWVVHVSLGAWNTRDRRIAPFGKYEVSSVTVCELGAVPVFNVETEPINDSQFKVTIYDFQDGRFDPPLNERVNEYFGNTTSAENRNPVLHANRWLITKVFDEEEDPKNLVSEWLNIRREKDCREVPANPLKSMRTVISEERKRRKQ